jgi:hypothetical protein
LAFRVSTKHDFHYAASSVDRHGRVGGQCLGRVRFGSATLLELSCQRQCQGRSRTARSAKNLELRRGLASTGRVAAFDDYSLPTNPYGAENGHAARHPYSHKKYSGYASGILSESDGEVGRRGAKQRSDTSVIWQ